MKPIKKVGLFGGSFNLVHNQHIEIIMKLVKRRLVDEVWIMPCKKHAFSKNLSSAKHRIKMIQLAIKSIKKAKVCRTELNSRRTNYTIKTLRELRKQYPHRFFLINGSDIFHEIKRWNNYKQLLNEAEFIIFKRKGYPIRKINNLKFQLVKEKPDNTSSAKIRRKIKQGKSLKNLVPLPVKRYIIKEKLYK